jgi:hypothetical protein
MQKCLDLNNFAPLRAGYTHVFLLLAFVWVSFGCVQSPNPTVGELILINPPVFTLSSSNNATVTTPTKSITLNGTCDPAGYGLYYAIDQTSSWTPIPGDCVGGAFTLTVPIHRISTIYARAKTKLAYTSIAQIRVHYVLAPSSPVLSLASSATSNDDSLRNIQSVIGHSYSGEQVSSASRVINTYLPRMVYEQ